MQAISSANTSSVVSCINSSLYSSVQALTEIQQYSSMLVLYSDVFSGLEERVSESQATVGQLLENANRTREVRDATSARLGLVRDAFMDLQPVDETKLLGVRELLETIREALREADIYGTYQRLRERLDHQRSERTRLEAQVGSLMADIDQLRKINDALPVLPDRCS